MNFEEKLFNKRTGEYMARHTQVAAAGIDAGLGCKAVQGLGDHLASPVAARYTVHVTQLCFP